MDASTRPPQKRHQAARHMAFGLVAVLCLTTAPQAIAATQNNDSIFQPKNLPSTAPAAHDIAMTTVPAGEEGLELSARFSEDSSEIVKGVEWSVTDESGAQVFDGISAIAQTRLEAGDYRVSATYGTTHVEQGLSVHTGTKLIVSFVLNAGGLRVLPRVKNIGLPHVPSESRIYALSGTARGQLVSTSFTPGEVIKISAGDYRVESRFETGNAISITDVKVKPGIMSAINIDHIAGIAHLTYQSSNPVEWTITDDAGTEIHTTGQADLNLVLQPGNYTAKAEANGANTQKRFKIEQGEEISILLKN